MKTTSTSKERTRLDIWPFWLKLEYQKDDLNKKVHDGIQKDVKGH